MKKIISIILIVQFLLLLGSISLFSVSYGKKKNNGINNYNNSFVEKLKAKYKLQYFETRLPATKIIIKDKNGKDKKKIIPERKYMEYRNYDTGLIVFFDKNPRSMNEKKENNYLNTICLYSKNLKLAKNVGYYFISSLQASNNLKKRWKNYLNKLAYNTKPTATEEFAEVPSLRCITQKIKYKDNQSAYYLEIEIIE